MKATVLLPITLLVSVAAYGMDNEDDKIVAPLTVEVEKKEDNLSLSTTVDKKNEEAKTIENNQPELQKSLKTLATSGIALQQSAQSEEKQKNKHSAKEQPSLQTSNVINIATKESVVFNAPVAFDKSIQSSSISAEKDLEKQLQKRGYVTSLNYYRDPVGTLIYELQEKKFDPQILVNKDYMQQAIKHLISQSSVANLALLHTIIDQCHKQSIAPGDDSLSSAVQTYALKIRNEQEDKLVADSKEALAEANKKRTQLIAHLAKVFSQSMDEMEKMSLNLKNSLETTFKKHVETIATATHTKRKIRAMNTNLPEEGYDSDTETTYDEPFIKSKKGLDRQIQETEKSNRKATANIGVLKGFLDTLDTTTIQETEGITNVI